MGTTWSTKDAHVVAERADLSVEERRLVGVQEHVYELDNRLRLAESKIGFERRGSRFRVSRCLKTRRRASRVSSEARPLQSSTEIRPALGPV